jgi:hypothetical protein
MYGPFFLQEQALHTLTWWNCALWRSLRKTQGDGLAGGGPTVGLLGPRIWFCYIFFLRGGGMFRRLSTAPNSAQKSRWPEIRLEMLVNQLTCKCCPVFQMRLIVILACVVNP